MQCGCCHLSWSWGALCNGGGGTGGKKRASMEMSLQDQCKELTLWFIHVPDIPFRLETFLWEDPADVMP